MQQSDLDLTMLFGLVRQQRTINQHDIRTGEDRTGLATRVRTLISGPRRPIGRRVGQLGTSSSR